MVPGVTACLACLHARRTDADPRWVSPVDIMHMREGDVSSFTPVQPLQYVGHLKKWNLYNAVFG